MRRSKSKITNIRVKKSKFRQAVEMVLAVLSICVLVSSITFSSTILYHHYYYSTFWVSGQSMYPTLNFKAKDSTGNLYGASSKRSMRGASEVDYGFMDTHSVAIDSLERFDIVVFKITKDDYMQVIKRVIALPGETFYITSSSDVNENGQLYIKDTISNEFNMVSQPIDQDYVKNGKYLSEHSTSETAITLGENEYYFLGDNRIGDHSHDSRSFGAIPKENIVGKVIGLEGYCKIDSTDTGVLGPVEINHYLPRYF